MGYNTTILILNDYFNEIDKDPVTWWEKVQELHYEATIEPQRSYNGTTVISNEHADHLTVIAVGGNHANILGRIYQGWNKDNETILREIASQHGFRLVRKDVK